jgi:hypothetical protein
MAMSHWKTLNVIKYLKRKRCSFIDFLHF